jgi:hypothetical protein
MHCAQPSQVALMAHGPPALELVDALELVVELELAPLLLEWELVAPLLEWELVAPLLEWELVAPLLAWELVVALLLASPDEVVRSPPAPPVPWGRSSAPRTSAHAGAASAAPVRATEIQLRAVIRTLL